MAAALHTLRYINRDSSQGLFFNNKNDFQLEALCDSDWAQCPYTYRSVGGFFIMLGGSLISWRYEKQPIVALTSAEAEYRSMHAVTAELAWLTRLLYEFQVSSILPVPPKVIVLQPFILQRILFSMNVPSISSLLVILSRKNFKKA